MEIVVVLFNTDLIQSLCQMLLHYKLRWVATFLDKLAELRKDCAWISEGKDLLPLALAASQEDKGNLENIISTASKIIGHDLPSLETLYTKRALTKARRITTDDSHPAT